MNALERNKTILAKYIPLQAVPILADWIYTYNFKLKIKKSRSTKQGDYSPPHEGKNHTITINHDLNPYSFLITLLHEVAHLITWEKYKGRVNPHGSEWADEYSTLLLYFLKIDKSLPLENKLFPAEITTALQKHLLNPSASSCTDIHLFRVLRKFDADSHELTLEQISLGASFRIIHSKTNHSTELFIKGEKRRTRYHCIQQNTRKAYLVHALCKVVVVAS
jgi:hypothetical protein